MGISNPKHSDFKLVKDTTDDTADEKTRDDQTFITAINLNTCDLFQDMCAFLLQFDVYEHYQFIKKTILAFSLRIRGLPYCPDEDLPLQVYFYLEDKLNIECSIELCVVMDDYKGSNIIGVLFNSKKTRNKILESAPTVRKYIKIRSNKNFKWILDNIEGGGRKL